MNKRIGISLLCAAVAAGNAFGQYNAESVTSYIMRAPKPIVVFSNSSIRLPGRGGLVEDETAALVEIRALRHGGSAVPPTPGNDSDRDPVILTTRIGAGIMEANPGRFAAVVPQEAIDLYAKSGTSANYRGFFARVYNTPKVEDATYYVNSNLVGYDPDLAFTNLTFSTAMKAIDPDAEIDSDNDGILDNDEVAIGTNPFNEDTDGDGFTDFEEIYFGLDPLSDSRPTIQAITTNRDEPTINAVLPDESEWHVEWHASTDPKVTYTLQFVEDVRTWSSNGTGVVHSYPVTNAITQTNWAQDITRWMTNWTTGFLRLGMELDRSGLDEQSTEGEDTQTPGQEGQ